MEYALILLVLAIVFGLFMAWGIGANDVANAMATSVGSRALTLKQAILIAAVFEFCGAFLAGGEVTATVRNGIVDTALLADTPDLLVYGMLASLLAAGLWLLLASHFGWPVSTTHSIVGAIVGFAIAAIGMDAVKWTKVGSIVISWVVSPLLAGVISFLLFVSVQLLILNRSDPMRYAKRYVPVYIFLAAFIISLVTLFKGLKHIGLSLTLGMSYTLAAAIALTVSLVGVVFIRRIKVDKSRELDYHFASVEKVFAVLMVVTACGMAFAHGSNDVANAIGPVAAVVSVISSGGQVAQTSSLSTWILLLGAIGLVIGLMTYGQHVMITVGKKITDLTPTRGFACELAAASTVVLASGTGLPISTTHTLVGAVLGVGIARGISALNMNVIRKIFMSWIVTLPAGGFLSVIFFFILREIFS